MTREPRTVGPADCMLPTAGHEARERSCFLTAFTPSYASLIASWVRSDEELTWLAPSTVWPLTASKVVAWGKDRDHCFLLWNGSADGPIGYTELNCMAGRPQTMWIGHFVVDPAQRGQSYGFMLAKALLAAAFGQYAATEVLLVVFPDNSGAIRCYERVGMVVLGREEKYFETTNRRHRFLRMGINRAKYLELAAAGRLTIEPLPFRTNLPAGRLVAGDRARTSDRTSAAR